MGLTVIFAFGCLAALGFGWLGYSVTDTDESGDGDEQ